MTQGILTLTTDFGTEGPYVAALKGILLGLAPGICLVDVTHAIAPQNILEGAFVLSGIVDAFPIGTVHLAVIDPGVGTDRRLLAAEVGGHYFVLPDNGLLSGVVRNHPPSGLWEITSPAVRRRAVSETFHGRDIMAPAAAHLLRGGRPDELGPPLSKFITLTNFEPRPDEHGIVGEVLFRDAFGNLITNVRAEHLAGRPPEAWSLELAGSRIDGLCRTYGERPTGTLIALVGSDGWVEVALVNGDASRYLGAGPGATVRFRKPRSTAGFAGEVPGPPRR